MKRRERGKKKEKVQGKVKGEQRRRMFWKKGKGQRQGWEKENNWKDGKMEERSRREIQGKIVSEAVRL